MWYRRKAPMSLSDSGQSRRPHVSYSLACRRRSFSHLHLLCLGGIRLCLNGGLLFLRLWKPRRVRFCLCRVSMDSSPRKDRDCRSIRRVKSFLDVGFKRRSHGLSSTPFDISGMMSLDSKLYPPHAPAAALVDWHRSAPHPTPAGFTVLLWHAEQRGGFGRRGGEGAGRRHKAYGFSNSILV